MQDHKKMNNSKSIIRGWKEKAEKPLNKYNVGFIRAVEDWSGESAADYRDGYDTGIDPQNYQFNESIA